MESFIYDNMTFKEIDTIIKSLIEGKDIRYTSRSAFGNAKHTVVVQLMRIHFPDINSSYILVFRRPMVNESRWMINKAVTLPEDLKFVEVLRSGENKLFFTYEAFTNWLISVIRSMD